MRRAFPLWALLFVAGPVPVAAAGQGAFPVVASCADGSVVFARRFEDVHCEGAIRMPDGMVPRVGSLRDRAWAVALERDAARERKVEAEIEQAVECGPPRDPGPRCAARAGEEPRLLPD